MPKERDNKGRPRERKKNDRIIYFNSICTKTFRSILFTFLGGAMRRVVGGEGADKAYFDRSLRKSLLLQILTIDTWIFFSGCFDEPIVEDGVIIMISSHSSLPDYSGE